MPGVPSPLILRLQMEGRASALQSIRRWDAKRSNAFMPASPGDFPGYDDKENNMLRIQKQVWIFPAAGACLLAAGCSQWNPAMIHRDSHAVEAITQAQPPVGTLAQNPAVMILRPAVQAAAQAAGPMGGTVLGIVAAIASLIAGATGTAAARSRGQLNRHKQAVSELARVIPPGTILHPATQRVITAATS